MQQNGSTGWMTAGREPLRPKGLEHPSTVVHAYRCAVNPAIFGEACAAQAGQEVGHARGF